MNAYKFYGTQTVTWYSNRTGRKMAPSARSIHLRVDAESNEAAIEAFRRLADSRVNSDQKRDVVLSGTVNRLGHKANSPLYQIVETFKVGSAAK